MDSEELDPEKHIFPDNATKRQILSHCVKCQNEECDWTGQYREFESHECQFQMVTCQKGECSEEILRKKLEEHQKNDCRWRDYQCIYCGSTLPFWKKPVHLQKCGKAPVKCTKRCKESEQSVILREELKDHLKNECSLTVVCCQYKQMGCKEKILRSEMQKHLDSQMQNHLQLACKKVSHLSRVLSRVKKLEEDLQFVKAKLTRSSNPPFILRIENFEQRIKNGNCIIRSHPFYSSPNGYKFKVEVYLNGTGEAYGTHMSVFIHFVQGEYDAILPWPFLRKITISILDQQENGNNIIRSFKGNSLNKNFKRPTKGTMGWGYSHFATLDRLKTQKYLVDDTLFIQVHVGTTED